jgi:hypothetical protein
MKGQSVNKDPSKKKDDECEPGVKSKINEKLINQICQLIMEGSSLWQIGAIKGMPNKATLTRWIKTGYMASLEVEPDINNLYYVFYVQYGRAKEVKAEFFAEEIIEISDSKENDIKLDEHGVPVFDSAGNPVIDHNNVARAKLMVDTRKWIASRLLPKKYGAKPENEINLHVKNTTLTEEAKKILARNNIFIEPTDK